MIGGDKTQQRIMFALPFVFTIFIINFEAGLIVYWITTNVWTIGQQLVVRKLYPKPPGAAGDWARQDDGADDGGKPARGKPRTARAGAAALTDGGNGDGRHEGAARARRARRRSAPAGAGSLALEPMAPGLTPRRLEPGRLRSSRGRVPRGGQVGGDEGAGAALPRDHRRMRAVRGAREGDGRARAGCAARSTRTRGATWPRRELPEEPAERLRAVVTRVVQALGLRRDRGRRGDRRRAAGDRQRRGPRPAHRQARRDDRRAPAPRDAGRAARGARSASRSSSTPPATASGARRPSTARPTGRWRTRSGTAAPSSSSRCGRSSARSSTPT